MTHFFGQITKKDSNGLGKIITFSSNREHNQKLLKSQKLLTLSQIYRYIAVIYIYSNDLPKYVNLCSYKVLMTPGMLLATTYIVFEIISTTLEQIA